jgi:hypothetical protein
MKISVQHPLLQRLRKFDAEIVPPGSHTVDDGLGAVGLILSKKLDESRYECYTPANCITFAHTGGEGVHFSFLCRDGAVEAESPIVITNPGAWGNNFVVGEDLFDFLCLGCHRGYFALEQLAYDRDTTLEVYTNEHWQPSNASHHSVGYCPDEKQTRVLRRLTEALRLRPWTDPKRFELLQKRFLSLLAPPLEQY